MKKRISALLMAFVMTLSLFPTTAFAVGEEADPLTAKVGKTSVTVADPAGALPEGAELSVKQLNDEDAEQYVAAIESSGITLSDPLVLNVTILDQDGNECQPAEGKEVQLSFNNKEFSAATSVWHFPTVKEETPTLNIKKAPVKAAAAPSLPSMFSGLSGVQPRNACVVGSLGE